MRVRFQRRVVRSPVLRVAQDFPIEYFGADGDFDAVGLDPVVENVQRLQHRVSLHSALERHQALGESVEFGVGGHTSSIVSVTAMRLGWPVAGQMPKCVMSWGGLASGVN